MFFPDLTRYSYSAAALPMLNVGWLGSGDEFERGQVSDVVWNALVVMARESVNMMRGDA